MMCWQQERTVSRMPREKAGYRDNLEFLNGFFPDKNMLSRADIIEFTGLSRKVIDKNFPFSGRYISKPDFARMISQGDLPC
jgi:hypothetical protein